MSEQIGETFVTITPLVNEQQFKAKAEPEINRAVQSIKVDFPPFNPPDLTKFKTQLRELAGSFRQAGLTGDESLFGSIQGRSQSLRGEIQAAGVGSSLAAEMAAVTAAEETARVEMTRFVASVEQAKLETIQLAAAEKERAAISAAASRQSIRGLREQNDLQAQTFRSQFRNVTQGRAGIDSLLSPAAIGRFALGGLAIGAVFQGVQHLEDALKVTGDEAFTLEGKFRNAGAELLRGDLIAGIQALIVQAPSARDELKKLGAAAGTSSVDLRNFSIETNRSAEEEERLAGKHHFLEQATKILDGRFLDLTKSARSSGKEMRDAAADALALAAAADTAAQAVIDVTQQITAAGSEAAAFGERTRGVVPPNPRTPTTPDTTDDTATSSTASAVARSRAERTKGLQDDLAVAQQDEADARRLQETQKGIVEGRAERYRAVVEAHTKVVRIDQQIAAQAEQDRKDRAAAQKKEVDERAQALRDALDFREQTLQLALQEAQATEGTIADDRKALRGLIAFEHEKSQNRALERDERLAALAKEKAYRSDLANLNKQALAEALGVKRQHLLNAIEASKLTVGEGDDKKADRAFLSFLKGRVAASRGNAQAFEEARSELISFQLSLKDKKGGAGSAFTLRDLFQEAGDEFAKFGSNVSPTAGGVLSGQDARAVFSQTVLSGGDPRLGVARSQLTEQEKTNQILNQILEAQEHGRGRGPAGASRGTGTGTGLTADEHGFGPSRAARLAAKYGVGG